MSGTELIRYDAMCQAIAAAYAVVSAKPAEHFRTSPGGYFHDMVVKAKAGELNPVRTIWGVAPGEGR